ncbi:putative GTP-binding protein EngB [Colletotrichum spinosum]|uniref:Putative GTP-binding protein EngB n=1 Tax=Colletotrichum spinosum TaxID=1347390 RepID=A0A4R8QV34_9PEZI|nr:putative GTP-binding protein EngB [Colletotrichum spinosum]
MRPDRDRGNREGKDSFFGEHGVREDKFPPRSVKRPQNTTPSMLPVLPERELAKIISMDSIREARSMYFSPPTHRPLTTSETTAPSSTADGGSIITSSSRSAGHDRASRYILDPPATFLYGAYNFKDHPVNTTTPEICVLGASNVGKSTFVNALTGIGPGSRELARISARPGATRAMNAFGIGDLRPLPHRTPSSPKAFGEQAPRHGMVLVDTPGYGFASRKDWGKMVLDYLQKRTMLRGAVLLLAAEKGVTAQDEMAIRLLAGSGCPAMVVFTKLDKIARRKGSEGFAQRLREAERTLTRAGLGRRDRGSGSGSSGGWSGGIWLTSAAAQMGKQSAKGHFGGSGGMEGVRMEVLRMAGLYSYVTGEKNRDRVKPAESPSTVVSMASATSVGGAAKAREEDKVAEEIVDEAEIEPVRVEPGKAVESDPAKWSGEEVSFEELEKKFGDWSS